MSAGFHLAAVDKPEALTGLLRRVLQVPPGGGTPSHKTEAILQQFPSFLPVRTGFWSFPPFGVCKMA